MCNTSTDPVHHRSGRAPVALTSTDSSSAVSQSMLWLKTQVYRQKILFTRLLHLHREQTGFLSQPQRAARTLITTQAREGGEGLAADGGGVGGDAESTRLQTGKVSELWRPGAGWKPQTFPNVTGPKVLLLVAPAGCQGILLLTMHCTGTDSICEHNV